MSEPMHFRLVAGLETRPPTMTEYLQAIERGHPRLNALPPTISVPKWFVFTEARPEPPMEIEFTVPSLGPPRIGQLAAGDEVNYRKGRYDMCLLMLTSPRFDKLQREAIEEQALKEKDKLKMLGFEFDGVENV